MSEPTTVVRLSELVPAGLLSRSAATAAGPGSVAWDLAFAAHHAPMGARQGEPGIDYAWTKPGIPAIKAAGDVWVAQYFSRDPAKNLTPARAAQLLEAKIRIVVVWEYTANAARGGKTQGQRDATDAETQAKACHLDGIPIYGAVDYDAPPGDQGAINGYFDGFADVLGDDRGRNGYGGYWPLSRGKASGHLKRLWGTPAWSGAEWSTSGLRPDIMQGAMVNVGGVQCDLDAGLSADFGQWPRPAAPVAGRTWGEWKTTGRKSLEEIAQAVNMLPSSVLRRTAIKYQSYDAVIAGYVNGLAAGTVHASDPVPAGGALWVLK